MLGNVAIRIKRKVLDNSSDRVFAPMLGDQLQAIFRSGTQKVGRDSTLD
jgi:hypothetical protein